MNRDELIRRLKAGMPEAERLVEEMSPAFTGRFIDPVVVMFALASMMTYVSQTAVAGPNVAAASRDLSAQVLGAVQWFAEVSGATPPDQPTTPNRTDAGGN